MAKVKSKDVYMRRGWTWQAGSLWYYV